MSAACSTEIKYRGLCAEPKPLGRHKVMQHDTRDKSDPKQTSIFRLGTASDKLLMTFHWPIPCDIANESRLSLLLKELFVLLN